MPFSGQWMDILAPYCERSKECTEHNHAAKPERKTVTFLMANLLTSPFASNAVHAVELALRGLSVDIAEGGLQWRNQVDETLQRV